MSITSSLFDAVKNNDDETAKKLLDAGADVDSRNEIGATPLFLSVLRGNVKMVKLFLESGADIYSATQDGRTPLGLARSILADPMGISGSKADAQQMLDLMES